MVLLVLLNIIVLGIEIGVVYLEVILALMVTVLLLELYVFTLVIAFGSLVSRELKSVLEATN